MPAFTADPQGLRHVSLPVQALQPAAFAPFGFCTGAQDRQPDWVAAGTRTAGVHEASESAATPVAELWRLGDLTYELDVPYVGFVRYFHQGFLVSELERHPHETQGWLCQSGSGVVLVAEPGPAPGGPPAPEGVRAFLIEPGDFICIGAGIWMCHFFPLGPSAEYLVFTARREPEQDRETVDLAESGVVLSICLAASESS